MAFCNTNNLFSYRSTFENGPHTNSYLSRTTMDFLNCFMRTIWYKNPMDLLKKSIWVPEEQDLAWGPFFKIWFLGKIWLNQDLPSIYLITVEINIIHCFYISQLKMYRYTSRLFSSRKLIIFPLKYIGRR